MKDRISTNSRSSSGRSFILYSNNITTCITVDFINSSHVQFYTFSGSQMNVPILQCESKNTPPEVFWHFFPNGWEFLNNFLHTYYAFLSTLDYNFFIFLFVFCDSHCIISIYWGWILKNIGREGAVRAHIKDSSSNHVELLTQELDYISETSQSTAECELKDQLDQVAQWVGRPMGVGSGRELCPSPENVFFYNF